MSHSGRPTVDDLAAILSSDSDDDGEDEPMVGPKQAVGFRTSWTPDQHRNLIPPQAKQGFRMPHEHLPSGTEHLSLDNFSNASGLRGGFLTNGEEATLKVVTAEPSPIILSTGKPLKSILKKASLLTINPTLAPLSSSASPRLDMNDQPLSIVEELTIRIRDCLSYARSCFNAGVQPRSYSCFDIPVSECGTLITHLKHESNEASATFICTFVAPTAVSRTPESPPIFERWALPCGPTESFIPVEASNAQWWVGRARAAIKAGPYASAAEVAFVEKNLRGAETQRKNGKGEIARKKVREKMEECLRRQETSRRMYGSDECSVEKEVEGGVDGDDKGDGVEKRRYRRRI